MSQTLDLIREKYPAYKDVPDDELTYQIGTKYPTYLEQDEEFKSEFESAGRNLPTEEVSLRPPVLPLGVAQAPKDQSALQALLPKMAPDQGPIYRPQPTEGSGFISRPFVPLEEIARPPESLAGGLQRSVGRGVATIESPIGLATAPLMESAALRPIAARVFLGLAAKQAGEAAGTYAGGPKTAAAFGEAAGDVGQSLLMAAPEGLTALGKMLPRGSRAAIETRVQQIEREVQDASSKQEAARAANEASEREAISAAESRGLKAEVQDKLEDENVPWARQFGESIAIRTPGGKILFNRKNFLDWVRRNPGNKAKMIESLVDEEHLHGFVTDEDARAYAKNMTGLERWLVGKRYLGPGETWESAGLDEVDIGHEAIRGLLQDLSRVTPREIAERPDLRGRLTVKAIYFLENLIRKIREGLGTKASDVQRGILDRVQQNIDSVKPAGEGAQFARLRKPRETQPEMFLPPVSGAQVRPTAEQMGALPPPESITGRTVWRDAYQFLQKANDDIQGKLAADPNAKVSAPTFASFFKDARKATPGLMRGELAEIWDRAVGTRLQNASGEAVKALAKSLGIKTPARVADPVTARQAPALAREERLGVIAAQRSRQYLTRQIYDRLVKPAYPDSALTRERVSPEDISRSEETKQPIYSPVTGEELSDPAALGRRLTQDARRRMADPESVTKRVTLLRDERTGKAHLVGTYRDLGTGKAMLVDPTLTGVKVHRPLEQILKNYRPIASYLLDEPVKNFKQSFENLSDFEARFGEDARRYFQESIAPPPAEGEVAVPGMIERATTEPITESEAQALLDHLNMASERVDSPKWVQKALDDLSRGKAPANVRSAWLKIANELTRRGMSEDEALLQLPNEIYELEKESSGSEDFIRRSVGRYKGAVEEDVLAKGKQPTAEEAPSKTARELTMRERVPPTTVRPEQVPPGTIAEPRPAPPVPEGTTERARSARFIRNAKDELAATYADIVALGKNRVPADLVVRAVDSADNRNNNHARQVGNDIRLASVERPGTVVGRALQPWQKGNSEVLAAANAVVQSGGKQTRIPVFRKLVESGLTKAQAMASSGSWLDRRIGRAWVRNQEALLKELDYADAHWNDADLQETANRMRTAFEDQRNFEIANGYDIHEKDNYVPHRYDAALWSGKSILFQGMKVLGRKFRQAAKFETYYHASDAGPYLAVTRDGATLVEHRIRQGMQMINRNVWHEDLKNIPMPNGLPVAIDPVKGVGETWLSPRQDYKIVPVGGGKPLAIHEDLSDLVSQIVSPSVVEQTPGLRQALHLSQQLKHTLLVGDLFHLARVMYYGTSIMGKRAFLLGKSGWSVLDIAPKNVPEAVAKGIISAKDVAWADERVPYGPGGSITRRALAEKFYSQMGANLGRIQDALYKDLVTNLTPTAGGFRRGVVRVLDPSIGRYNRFLFDKLTRGLMTEANVVSFERQMKAKPNADPEALMRDIARDVNNYFGNIGRQGWLKSRTLQDAARIFWLAPQWVEGLVKKEAVAYSRLSGASAFAGQREGLTHLGVTGRAIGSGLVAMMGLTQAINLITRGKPTWQNEEKEHKGDAWIPSWGSNKEGFWLSPLAIYNELTHDLFRLAMTKPNFAEAVQQIGGNKESPILRSLMVMATGYTPRGEYIPSSGGRLKAAAAASTPLPISFGRYIQAGAHAVAPGMVPDVPAGALQRQAFGTAGIKIEPAATVQARVGAMAREFIKKAGLEKDTGWKQVMTTDPSYSKLRTAVRNNDYSEARNIVNFLRKTHTDDAIVKAMKITSKRPFTGSKENEKDFLNSLTPQQEAAYDRAEEQRILELEKFEDWFSNLPQAPTK